MTADHARTGAGLDEEPRVEQAMAVWDDLTAAEQREVFRKVARTVSDFGLTKDIDRLVRFAESIDGMVTLEQLPGYSEARRRTPVPPSEQGEGVGMAEVVRRLRE